MNHRDTQICIKILSEISILNQILEHVALSQFTADERTFRATCMTLINIGELVKAITPELRSAHPEIPWRAIAGMRDVTAHKYQTLLKEDVYETCTVDVPLFAKQLQKLLNTKS